MTTFLVRVELHQATSADYESLHETMRKAGFSRQIQGTNGVWYHLPTAEYYVAGDFSINQILSAAKTAANSTGKANGVIVAQSICTSWDGLIRA